MFEPEAPAVHLQNLDRVGQAFEKRACQAAGTKGAGPFIERQVGRHDGGIAQLTLREDLKQQFSAGW